VRARYDARPSPPTRTLLQPDAVTVLDLGIGATAVAVASEAPAVDATTRAPAGAAAREAPANRAMQDVERRRRSGGGTYLTRAQIARRNATRVTDLLRTMPGVTVRADENGVLTVELRGAPRVTFEPARPTPSIRTDSGAPPPSSPAGTPGQMVTRRCPAGFQVDGMPVDNGGSIDGDVQPDNIEVIEVFSGAKVPIEFAGRHSSCGLVLIWTRGYAQRSGPPTEQDGGR
jgi:hypothetical protein